MTETWAVIASYNRLHWLTQLVSQLRDAGVRPIIIDNGYQPPLIMDEAEVIRFTGGGERPNLSVLWNIGLRHARATRTPGTSWALLVLNDDVSIANPRSVERLIAGLDGHAGAFPNSGAHQEPYVLAGADHVPLHRRMSGWCFAVNGAVIDDGFEFDARFHWWYGDDDADWTLRRRGGVAMVADAVGISHIDPDGWRSTSRGRGLGIEAEQDRKRFITKWGSAPF